MSNSEAGGPGSSPRPTRDELYRQVVNDFGAAIDRLSGAYDPDPDRRRDLFQDVQIALWQSLAIFDGRCSLRTWVYRVAHNTATSRVIRRRTRAPVLVSLDELEAVADSHDRDEVIDQQRAMDRLLGLIRMLGPLDRQIILLYLEGLDTASIGDITGLSSGNVATKVHRVKKVLTSQFHGKAGPDGR